MKTPKNAKLVKGWTAKLLHAAFFQERHAFFLRIHLSWTTSCPSAGVRHHCLHNHPPTQARLVKARGDTTWPGMLVTDLFSCQKSTWHRELAAKCPTIPIFGVKGWPETRPKRKFDEATSAAAKPSWTHCTQTLHLRSPGMLWAESHPDSATSLLCDTQRPAATVCQQTHRKTHCSSAQAHAGYRLAPLWLFPTSLWDTSGC